MLARRSRRRLTALLMLALAISARAEVESVVVSGRRPVGFGPAAGVSGAFFGEVDGQRYLFKSNAPIRSHFGLVRQSLTGNVEGEWLSQRLMTQAGVTSPDVDVVTRPGRRHSYARVQHMGDMFPGQELVRGVDAVKAGDRVDMAAVHRMQAVDLLIGNPDRHPLNMWFVRDPKSGMLRPIAFDHNITLGTRQGFTGTANHTNWSAFEQPLVRTRPDGSSLPSVGAQDINGRNALYQDAVRHPGELRSLHAEAVAVQASLSEERIRTLVAEIPDEAIGGKDKAARRRELEEHLLRRRRELVPAVESYMRQHPAYQQAQWELGRLPEDVRARLPQDMGSRWGFVEALGPDGKFDQERLRRALGAAGITGAAAEEVQAHLVRQGSVGAGGTGPTGDGAPRTFGEVAATKDPFKGRTPSFDGLEFHATSGEGEYRSLDGEAAVVDEKAPKARQRAAQVAEAVVAGGGVQEGDRVRVRRRPGLLGGYQAEVVSAQGEVVEKGRYHTVGATTVGTSQGVLARHQATHGVTRVEPRATRRPASNGLGFSYRPRVRIHRRGR